MTLSPLCLLDINKREKIVNWKDFSFLISKDLSFLDKKESNKK